MRTRVVAFAGLALGGVAALVAGAQTWWQAEGEGATVGFSGHQSSAGLTHALALVVCAGVLLALAVGPRGSRVVAALLILAGAAMTVTGVLRQPPAESAVRTRLSQVSLTDQVALAPTAWAYAYASAGVLVVAAAMVMLARAGSWPRRVSRFERPPRASAEASRVPPGTPQGGTAVADPLRAWKALDAGLDPTAEETPKQGGPAA